MRDGYGKNKLFFLVVLSIVGIMLMPYGIFGLTQNGSRGKNRDIFRTESESRSDAEAESQGGSRHQDSGSDFQRDGEDERVAESIDWVVGITVKDLSRNVIYASGNGVVMENDGDELCIVTAGHVLERTDGDGHVLISFWTKENWTGAVAFEMECTHYERVQDADLAFLFLTKEQVGADDIENRRLQAVSVAKKQDYDALQTGDTVRTIAWDEEQKVIYEGTLLEIWNYVEDFSQYMILADCVMRPGMSGCGLYNAQDQLIGIACGGNEAGQLAAVPLHVVEACRK